MMERLYKYAIKGGYDVVDCDFFQEDEKGNVLERCSIPEDILIKNDPKLLIMNCGRVWTKLIRKSFLLENNIQFIEHKKFEDNPYLPILMSYNPYVGKVKQHFYHYQYNCDSTSRKKNDYSVFDRIDTAEYLLNEAIKRNKYAQYKMEFDAVFIGLYYVNTVITCLLHFDKPEFNYIKKVYFGIRKILPSFKSNLYIKSSPKYYRLIVMMNIHELKLVSLFINLIIKIIGKSKLIAILKH